MATMVLFKLGAFTAEWRYVDAAVAAVAPLQPAVAQAPTRFAWWLCGLEFKLAQPKEIEVVGGYLPKPPPSQGGGAKALLDVVFGEYRPNQVVAWKRDGEQSAIPLLEAREAIEGKATAYVCVRISYARCR